MSDQAPPAENGAHDCRAGCEGRDTELDRWNPMTGHWYCPNGNDNCAAHPRVTPAPIGRPLTRRLP